MTTLRQPTRFDAVRRLLCRGLVNLLAAVSLVACSDAAPPATSPAPDGYLYAAPGEVIFVRWAGHEGADAGTVDWRLAPDQRRSGAFTVERGASGFSFTFEPGTLAGWTGRFEGDGLVLTIPDTTGALRTVAFRPASEAEFEQATTELD